MNKQNILTNLVAEKAACSGDAVAYRYIDAEGRESSASWAAMAREVDCLACAFEMLDISPDDKVAVFSANCPEILLADFAAYSNRAVPVSIYATSSAEQVEYIVNDSGAKMLFVGDERQLAVACDVRRRCPSLSQVVVFDERLRCHGDEDVMTLADLIAFGAKASASTRGEVERRRREARPADVATLIYTSGTTGEPKGAILNHSCFNAALSIHRRKLPMVGENDTSLSFLPMSHIFEKAWTYFCLWRGMGVTINNDPRAIQDVIRRVQPTCMCSVPRFWEKVYTAVQEKLAAMTGLKHLLARRALKIGRRRNLDYVRRGRKVPSWLETRYQFYNKHVFMPLKRAIGIPKGNIFPTAGAPLSPKIVEFFHSCGIDIVIGYGLSETTATVTFFPPVGYEIGTVGKPLDEDVIHVRIGDNDEIQVKGPTVMAGYFNKPEADAEAFTCDGWFRTGDAGRFDEHGSLILTERIKDLFKTSNGKYIAPQALESRLGEDRFIEQVAVIGDQRKYVTAIIIPAFEALKEYALQKQIQYKSIEDLVKNSEIVRMISDRIEELQKGFAGFEKIKKFTLLPSPFTMENGELTNTLKIRRPVINSHYAREIEAMYA